MIKATAFQMETVKVACHALRSGSRRFRVADEAGLGKTVVAQRIIEEFSGRIRRGSRRGSRVMNVILMSVESRHRPPEPGPPARVSHQGRPPGGDR